MRALRIVAGIAVLLNALHFVHAIHHFVTVDGPHGAAGWAGIGAAALLDLLSFTGGFLLISQKN